MNMEGIGDAAEDALEVTTDIIGRVFSSVLKAGKAGDDVLKLLQKSPIVKGLSQYPTVKVLRACIAALNIITANPANNDVVKALNTVVSTAQQTQRARAIEIKAFEAQPGAETMEDVFKRIEKPVAELRSRFNSSEAERRALVLVLANATVLEGNTFLGGLHAKNPHAYEAGLKRIGVVQDNAQVFTGEEMNTEEKKKAYLDAVHKIYEDPTLKLVQREMRDTNLLHEYEVLFRAFHDPEWEKESSANWESVTSALQYFSTEPGKTGDSNRIKDLRAVLEKDPLSFEIA